MDQKHLSSKPCNNWSGTGAALTAALKLNSKLRLVSLERLKRKTRESVFGDEPEVEDEDLSSAEICPTLGIPQTYLLGSACQEVFEKSSCGGAVKGLDTPTGDRIPDSEKKQALVQLHFLLNI